MINSIIYHISYIQLYILQNCISYVIYVIDNYLLYTVGTEINHTLLNIHFLLSFKPKRTATKESMDSYKHSDSKVIGYKRLSD